MKHCNPSFRSGGCRRPDHGSEGRSVPGQAGRLFRSTALATTTGLTIALLAAPGAALAQDASGAGVAAQPNGQSLAAPAQRAEPSVQTVDEVVVTARRRSERLQDVPDSVTAFTAVDIQKAGIQSFGDFAALTPNLTFQDNSSYSVGASTISMRGIANGQQGWPSVSFLVDGVPMDSLDGLADGTMTDIERIEVLRGPQSALYGFNAIAGAINLITQRPTNEYTGHAQAIYASGDDKSGLGVLSGPIVEDKLLFRIQAYGRDKSGLIRSASNGRHLDPDRQTMFRGELLFTPVPAFEFDLRGEYNKVVAGSTYQSKIATPGQFDDFSPDLDPRRRLVGEEDHRTSSVSLRGVYHAPFADLVSITSYRHTYQTEQSSLCYDDPDSPLLDADPSMPGSQASCLFPINVFGSAATSGQPVDQAFLGLERYDSFFQDVRLQSTTRGRLNWTLGGSYLHRSAFNGFDAGLIGAPAAGGAGCANGVGLDLSRCGALTVLYPRWDAREDSWWGVYGQATYDVTDRLQLTFAARYDKQRYENTQFTSRDEQVVVPVYSPSGVLQDTQREQASDFQPKVQISYKWTPRVMTYFTFAEGFRAGYFNTGQFTRPEHTKNYEVGIKSSFDPAGIHAVVNASVFHIDYSDQQFSTVLPTPPFRISVTIPETKINGAEFEATIYPLRSLSISGSVGYLDAQVSDGTMSPNTPHWTLILSGDYSTPITAGFDFVAHADIRHNSSLYLSTGDRFLDPPRTFVNARAGVAHGNWSVTGFVRNLTDERDVAYPLVALSNGGYVRYINEPRQFGLQLDVDF